MTQMSSGHLVLFTALMLALSACGTEPEDVTDDESSALTTDAGSSISPDGTSSAPLLGPDGSPLPSCALLDLAPLGQEPTCAAGCWAFYAEAAWGCLPDGLNQGDPAFMGCVPDSINQNGISDGWTSRSQFTFGLGVRVNASLSDAMQALGALAPGDPGHEAAAQAMRDCMDSAGASFPTD